MEEEWFMLPKGVGAFHREGDILAGSWRMCRCFPDSKEGRERRWDWEGWAVKNISCPAEEFGHKGIGDSTAVLWLHGSQLQIWYCPWILPKFAFPSTHVKGRGCLLGPVWLSSSGALSSGSLQWITCLLFAMSPCADSKCSKANNYQQSAYVEVGGGEEKDMLSKAPTACSASCGSSY